MANQYKYQPSKGKSSKPKDEDNREIQVTWITENGQQIRSVKSCGGIIFRRRENSGNTIYEFLLMKHPNRYDLAKGHQEVGESEMQTALREIHEETGIASQHLSVVDGFQFDETYYPTYKRFGGAKVKKNVVLFLVLLSDTYISTIKAAEHGNFEWKAWNPPHKIQKNTIDPLLEALQSHFTAHPLSSLFPESNKNEN